MGEQKFQIGLFTKTRNGGALPLDPRLGTFMMSQLEAKNFFTEVTYGKVIDSSKSFCDESIWPDDELNRSIFERTGTKCFDSEYFIQGTDIGETMDTVIIQFITCAQLS